MFISLLRLPLSLSSLDFWTVCDLQEARDSRVRTAYRRLIACRGGIEPRHV